MKKNSPVSRSGRFAGGPAADVARFTQSVSFDWRLWRQDILGSMAHATMLRKIGVLSRAELSAVLRGLDSIALEIRTGKFRWNPGLEDVHMNIEAELTRRVPAGAKLHTGRSRNDQVALDLRLWLRDEILELGREVRLLQAALAGLGQKNSSVLIPGYTHLQRAQPVYFAHHLLAYVESTCARSAAAPSPAPRCRSTGGWSRNCSRLWMPRVRRNSRRTRWTP
jgi:argininosuccinate lyase